MDRKQFLRAFVGLYFSSRAIDILASIGKYSGTLKLDESAIDAIFKKTETSSIKDFFNPIIAEELQSHLPGQDDQELQGSLHLNPKIHIDDFMFNDQIALSVWEKENKGKRFDYSFFLPKGNLDADPDSKLLQGYSLQLHLEDSTLARIAYNSILQSYLIDHALAGRNDAYAFSDRSKLLYIPIHSIIRDERKKLPRVEETQKPTSHSPTVHKT